MCNVSLPTNKTYLLKTLCFSLVNRLSKGLTLAFISLLCLAFITSRSLEGFPPFFLVFLDILNLCSRSRASFAFSRWFVLILQSDGMAMRWRHMTHQDRICVARLLVASSIARNSRRAVLLATPRPSPIAPSCFAFCSCSFSNGCHGNQGRKEKLSNLAKKSLQNVNKTNAISTP